MDDILKLPLPAELGTARVCEDGSIECTLLYDPIPTGLLGRLLTAMATSQMVDMGGELEALSGAHVTHLNSTESNSMVVTLLL